jgi:hypothetical protein
MIALEDDGGENIVATTYCGLLPQRLRRYNGDIT